MGLGRSGAGGAGGLADVELSSFDGTTLSANFFSAVGAITANVNTLISVALGAGGGASSLTFSGIMATGGTLSLKNFDCPINWGTGPVFDDGNNVLVMENVVFDETFAPPSGCVDLTILGTTGITELDLTSTIPTTIDASGISTLTTVTLPTLGSPLTVDWNFSGNAISSALMDDLYAVRVNISGGSFNLGTTLYPLNTISSLAIADAGTDFVTGDFSASGGTGTGLVVHVDSIDGGGEVTSASVTTQGSGYTNGDTVTIANGGIMAQFTLVMVNAQIASFVSDTGATVTYNHA